MMNKYEIEHDRWKKNAVSDPDVIDELNAMETDKNRLEDAFYRDLAFGTGGLRGVIGAGTNRMNIYTVGKASQGLSSYVNQKYSGEKKQIAISFDSRKKSLLFAKMAARVFAANGIRVWIYSELMPTPCLSYAVRSLGCCAGIMVTASHNPAQYNGYKVYGEDGCQITVQAADAITKEIEKVDLFNDVKLSDYDRMLENGMIRFIPDEIYTSYFEKIKKQSVLFGDEVDRNVAIVYTPLNGTGLKPVLRALGEGGFGNVTVVEEQKQPDGNFPTCPYPNPEISEAMRLGIEYAKRENADLLLATDPDCDRVGIAVRESDGGYVLLSGNETGILLLDYICSQRLKHGMMPSDPILVKTIVTTDMAERIALAYGVRTINVLTGFKFIGEQIGLLEKRGCVSSYILGFEESYGYLSGSYVRDKDAVNGAFLICEMIAFYKTAGISLLDKLNELYQTYGFCLNTLHSYKFDGMEGFEKMQRIMDSFRKNTGLIGGKNIERVLDYKEGIDGLPRSNVLKYILEGNSSVVVRPSGTEPKIKLYISVSEKDRAAAAVLEERVVDDLRHYFIQ